MKSLNLITKKMPIIFIQHLQRTIMNDDIFQLLPLDPNTDNKITLYAEQRSHESILMVVNEWRRILPNKNYLIIDNNSFSYQCTPLDKNCIIEVKFSYQKYGTQISRSLSTKPVKLTNEVKEKSLYIMEAMKCLVLADEFKTPMLISVEKNKLRFAADLGKFDLSLKDTSLEADINMNTLKVNLENSRNQFLSFFSACLRWAPKYRSNHCLIIFNTKLERDLIMNLGAEVYQTNLSNSQLKNSTPRNGRSPNLVKDTSGSSLTSMNKSKNKDKEKVKISERLNLKRSNNKGTGNIKSTPNVQQQSTNQETSVVSSNLLQSGECLNIFEDDDEEFLMGASTNKHDQSMDLRGSFDELQSTSVARFDQDKRSNHSFSAKNTDNLEDENKKLREENKQLKKQVQSLQMSAKQVTGLKKKYMASIDEINRLENERRAIITDKVKFESKYHKQVQQKDLLIKQLQMYRAKYGKG